MNSILCNSAVMGGMEDITNYYRRKISKLTGNKKVSELTEAQRRHAESSTIFMGCVLQTMAQNEIAEKEKKKNGRG